MKTDSLALLASIAAFSMMGTASAQRVDRGSRPIIEVAQQLKNGEYVWAPELSPSGSALLVVNLAAQQAILFRNGVPTAATTISSGAPGRETPTGVFTILQKNKEHYSSTYDNAPMPNMQRLTWKGIALHAGKLPGYPASHGCIRLPPKFSELLFGATSLGMTVVITSVPVVPGNSGTPDLVRAGLPATGAPLADAPYDWHPERAGDGLVSVIVSAADQRAIVFRGDREIGSAPVRVKGSLDGGMAYVLRAWDSGGQHWIKLQFSGRGEGADAWDELMNRFEGPAGFREAVAATLRPGSVVVVVPESLSAGSPGRTQTIIDNDQGTN